MTEPLAISAGTVIGVPVGWLAWLWAQRLIDRRQLEKGDTEVLLPAYSAVLLTSAIFAALGWRFGASPSVLVVYIGIFGLLVVMLLVDFGRYCLPNELIALALGLGLIGVLVVSVVNDAVGSIQFALAGTAITFGVYIGFFLLAVVLFGGHAFGLGDVKLSSVLGLAMGWLAADYRELFALIIWSVFIGFLSGALVSIALLRGVKMRTAFPQGPFLILGTLAVILFSRQIVGS